MRAYTITSLMNSNSCARFGLHCGPSAFRGLLRVKGVYLNFIISSVLHRDVRNLDEPTDFLTGICTGFQGDVQSVFEAATPL